MSWTGGYGYPTYGLNRADKSAIEEMYMRREPTYADEDYIICVTAEDRSGLRRDDPWITYPELSVTWNVEISYYSHLDLHKRWPFRDYYQQYSLPAKQLVSSTPLDHDSLREAICKCRPTIMVPFLVYGHTRLGWKELTCSSSSSSLITPLESKSAMVDKICSVLAGSVLSGRGMMDLLVTVHKQITLPDQQFEAFRANREMLRCLDPQELLHLAGIDHYFFLVEQQRQQHQPRNSEETAARLFGSKPATKASVEALDKFTVTSCGGHDDDMDSNDPMKMCAICRGEMLIGSRVTCMPCSHMFHSDCALKWLTIAHTCPLCRFKLPN